MVAQRGAVPSSLCGAYLRNGPNPFFRGKDLAGGYHWFDGDGMVHSVRLPGGDGQSPSYASHYVRTRRLAEEKKAGWPCYPKLGDSVGAGGLGVLLLDRLFLALGLDGGARKAFSDSTANTALASHAGRILALNEGGLPHALQIACDGLVRTIGLVTFGGAYGAGGSVRAPSGGTAAVGAPAGDGNSNGKSDGDNSSIKDKAAGAPVTSFTAHPKLDPRTNVLHAFRYTFDSAPYAYYFAIGPDGRPLGAPRALSSLPRATMMHDFAVTARHAVFFDLPLVFDGARMVKEKQLPFRFAPEHGARVGLLPFDDRAQPQPQQRRKGAGKGEGPEEEDGGGDGVIWYQADEPFMMFHTAACWEEEQDEEEDATNGDDSDAAANQDAPAAAANNGAGGRRGPPGVVKVVCGGHETISLDLDKRCGDDAPGGGKGGGKGGRDINNNNNNNGEGVASFALGPSSSSIPEGERPYMSLLTLEPRARRCARRKLTKIAGDFPVVNPLFVGAKARFVWFATLSHEPGRTVKFSGIAKLDLLVAEQEPESDECVVARAALPAGTFCGEAVFAPRHADPALCRGEDDGFLLTYAHDEDSNESWFLVFCARTMDEVCACRLPSRVPYGFHGTWVPEATLQAARAADDTDAL